MKRKRENGKDGENNQIKTGLIISPHAVKTGNVGPPKNKYPTKYSPSFSFPCTNSSEYLKYLLEKFGDDLHIKFTLSVNILYKHNMYIELIQKNFQISMHISLIHL